MHKLIAIALKDLVLAFRDRAALILMLAAPFALTLGLGLVTGRFSSDSSGLSNVISNIPVVIVNQDDGQLGQALVDVFTSPDLGTLVKPMTSTDVAAASKMVDDDAVAAALIIPAGFTNSIIPSQTTTQPPTQAISLTLHVNPVRSVGASVIQSIVETYLSRVEASRISGQVAIEQLFTQGLIQPSEILTVAQAFGERQASAATAAAPQVITIQQTTAQTSSADEAPPFDILAYLAPGMALLFLMFTVTRGGAQLLAERDAGTLARMLTTPTSTAQVLGGKVVGIFLTAFAQVGILILASAVLFGLKWGNPIGVVLLAATVALAATGWGLLLTSFVKTPQQAGSLGAAVMLMFGVLGGSFGTNVQLPGFLQNVGRITPNAWGIQGFVTLSNGGTLAEVLPNVAALLAIAAVTFTIAVVLFQRNGFIRK